MSNYSFKEPNDIENNSIITEGNFTQLEPNTEIMKDLNLTINGGNFTNVKKQSQWTINGGNFKQISWCTHLHPKLVNKGLTQCATECKHMTNKEEVWVDGELIDTIYTYEDIQE